MEDLAPLLSGLPQRGTRSNGATKPTAAGDVARLLGEVAKKSLHPRISLPFLSYFWGAGVTKSTAAEELAPVLGEYANFTPLPRMVLSGL